MLTNNYIKKNTLLTHSLKVGPVLSVGLYGSRMDINISLLGRLICIWMKRTVSGRLELAVEASSTISVVIQLTLMS